MRIIFTIILNGLHHLRHNHYALTLANACDYWIIAEGAVGNNGSTSWCKPIPSEFHNNGRSIDGSIDFIKSLPKNVILIQKEGLWDSKDEQVNAAVIEAKKYGPGFLWEIDCDEQWSPYDMAAAEKDLINQRGKTGCFLSNYFVGPNLIARGVWGEGRGFPYKRLWNWNGELFASHEPPILFGGNGPEILLPQRFNHYAYFFEQDVLFKETFYTGHDHIHQNWKSLQCEKNFPQPISKLVSGHWGNTNTIIEKV